MTRCRPCAVFGTSSVKVVGPRAARLRTVSSSAGVAAVRWATTRTRVGLVEDSMTELLSAERSSSSVPPRRPFVQLPDRQEVDHEHERLVRLDHRWLALWAIGLARRDDEHPPAAHLH